MPIKRRPFYTTLVLAPVTAARTISMFRHLRMGPFVPFLVLLLVGSVLLWVVNTIAPLAPFVYSLF